MGWRKAHGAGKSAVVQIEPLPADELPAPVDIPPGMAMKGGATKVKLTRYAPLPDTPEWAELAKMAKQFQVHHCKQLARMAGGRCGAAPSSMVASAALQLAASRWMFKQGATNGDAQLLKQASSIANDSRQNLMAAYELAVREAQARKAYAKSDPHRALEDALADDGS